MKLDRSKNALKSSFVGFLNTILTSLLQFASRTVMIYTLGTEYLGLGNLFTSILSVLSLAELGMSSAIVYSLYKPIAENNNKAVCSLLNFYKKVYRIIGTFILVAGIALIPFLDKLISGSYPNDISLQFVYLIFLGNTVLSYYAGAYKKCILVALQRNDIQCMISIVTTVLLYGGRILILIFVGDFYAYAMMLPVTTIINNIYTLKYTSNKYPYFFAKGKLEKPIKDELISKISSLFFFKLGEIVNTSVDSIVISANLGLTLLAQYNNYYYIISALLTFCGMYLTALLPGIGNSIVTESVEKNYRDFNKIFFLHAWIIGWCTICMMNLFQPFIMLWVGESNVLDFTIVILLAVSFYVWKIQDIVTIFKDANGFWERDRLRTLLTAGLNLAMSLLLVNKIGLAGVILATIIARIVIDIPWGTYILFDNYFPKKEIWNYIKTLLIYTTFTIVIGVITHKLCLSVSGSGVFSFLVKLTICGVFTNALYLLIFSRFNIARDAFELVKNAVKKKHGEV